MLNKTPDNSIRTTKGPVLAEGYVSFCLRQKPSVKGAEKLVKMEDLPI